MRPELIALMRTRSHPVRQDKPGHAPIRPDCDLVGVRGELAILKELGIKPDYQRMVNRPQGDGGIDLELTLRHFNLVTIDIKATDCRHGHLILQEDRMAADMYILAVMDGRQLVSAGWIARAGVESLGTLKFWKEERRVRKYWVKQADLAPLRILAKWMIAGRHV